MRTVLPPSDSNASLGKADIINHAVDYIRILQNEKLKMSSFHSKSYCKIYIVKDFIILSLDCKLFFIIGKELIRFQNKISHLCARIKHLVTVLKESKIGVPKEKPIKKTCLRVGSISKRKKESNVRNNNVKKLKKKPKLAPKLRPISVTAKPVNIPVLASTKPTFILPSGHLIKIDPTSIIPQPQVIFDIPKILLLPDYKRSEVLIAPNKNDATVTTSVNKRPIPSLATYNRLLKETNFLKDNKVEIANDTKLKRTPENKNELNKIQIIEDSTNEKKIEENKHSCSEPVKLNDNKSTTSHTIEAIVKNINQDKNEKSIDQEEIITSELICEGSKNELKSVETENARNNDKLTIDVSECLSATQTTSTVVNSLTILTEESQRKSMETAKNIMSCFDDIRLPIPNSDFSTDLFSSLQGPVGGHHADSMSPTEAFLLSFPLVSTSKNTNILNETEPTELHSATPTTILQIGNLESPATELFQKNVNDCEKNLNKDKMKDQFSFNDKPYYNDNYIDTSKKTDQMYGYKEIKKIKAIPPPKPTASTFYKTTYNDISSYYKTTQSNSDLWRYTSYNSFDKNLNKNIKKTDKSTSTVFANNVPYVPYDLNTVNATTYIDSENYHEVWPHKPKQKKKQNEKSVPVNWMTDKSCQNSYSKKDDYSYQKKNNFDMSFDLQTEPKQTYSWSPSKNIPLLPHLDTNMPSTLPTLVGDLALNINTGSNTPFDQRVYECNKKSDNIIPVTSSEQNMFNYKSRSVNSNFFSVSQLVEQPKSNDKRKGKNCAKDYCCIYQNQKTDKDYYQNQTKQYYPEINTYEQDQSWVRSKYSHDSSRSTNHSAESLIRHQQKNGTVVKSSTKNQNIINKQTTCYRTGQKTSCNNNENFGNYYNQPNSNYLYDNRNELDKQPSGYQIPTNFYNPATTTKHNIANYIPLPTTFSMSGSSYNKPVQHFAQNTNNYYNSSSNVNTLTNFNLSTIFPEMIDKVYFINFYLFNNNY